MVTWTLTRCVRCRLRSQLRNQLVDALEFSDEAAKRTVVARLILIVLICFELLISRSFYTAVVDEDASSTVVAVPISSKSLMFSLSMSSTCVRNIMTAKSEVATLCLEMGAQKLFQLWIPTSCRAAWPCLQLLWLSPHLLGLDKYLAPLSLDSFECSS